MHARRRAHRGYGKCQKAVERVGDPTAMGAAAAIPIAHPREDGPVEVTAHATRLFESVAFATARANTRSPARPSLACLIGVPVRLHQGGVVYLVYVGRRRRQRTELERPQVREPRDRMARVQASDETWAAFRAQLGVTPVSVALGRLVEREVARTARTLAGDAEGVRVALEDAREVAGELAALIARLELLAEPVSGGGSR